MPQSYSKWNTTDVVTTLSFECLRLVLMEKEGSLIPSSLHHPSNYLLPKSTQGIYPRWGGEKKIRKNEATLSHTHTYTPMRNCTSGGRLEAPLCVVKVCYAEES